jgi:transposase
MLDHILEPPRPVRRLEVITGSGVRRRWTADEKARILEEALAPCAVVSEVARRHGMSPQHLFTWRREAKRRAADDRLAFAPVVIAPETLQAAPARGCGAVIEIVLGSAVVRVPPGTDASALMMVLHALQSMR